MGLSASLAWEICIRGYHDINIQRLTIKEVNGDPDEDEVSAIDLQLRALTQKQISFFMANKDKFLKVVTEPEIYEKLEGKHKQYISEDFSNLLGLLSHNDDDFIVVFWNLTLSFFFLKCLMFTQWLPPSALNFHRPS